MNRTLYVSIALMLCPLSSLHAQTVREHGVHEHGAASLAIALDGSRVYIDFDSPAYNVLGFEHAPSSTDQQEVLDVARLALESGSSFVFDSAAGCSLESAEVMFELAGESDHEGEHEHEASHSNESDHDGETAHADGSEHEHEATHADESDHGDETAHADESEHEHEASHADESDHGDEAAHADESEHEHEAAHSDESEHADEDAHSDVEAMYVYQCERAESLERITTSLFDTFESFEDIDVQLIGPGGQTGLELNAEQTVIELGAVR